jgi:hypothetical protein
MTRKVKFYNKKSTKDTWEVYFDIEGQIYSFTAETDEETWGETYWSVFFVLGKGEGLQSFLKGIKVTGTGSAIKVFGAVAQALKMFVKDKKPKLFKIVSSLYEPSRLKLYQRFIPQIEKMTGYKLKEKYDSSEDRIWVYKK